MLANYYHSMGLYAISSEKSSSSESESDENEGESFASDELSHYSDVSVNLHLSESATPVTPSIDVRQFIVASTSDYEGSELFSIDVKLWSSSVSTSTPSLSPS